MTLIDLGELRDESLDEPVSRRPPPIGRPVRVGLLLLLLLVTMAGAAPSIELPSGLTVPAGTGTEAVIADGRLYVLDPEAAGRVGAGRHLAAFTLPAGTPLWRLPLPLAGRLMGFQARDGRIFVSVAQDEGPSAETLAYAAADGRQLWRQPGDAIPTERGGLLLRSWTYPSPAGDSAEAEPPEGPADGGRGVLRAVDPASGAERWSRPFNDLEFGFAFGDGADQPGSGYPGVRRLVTVTAAGRAEVHDPDSGELLRSADLRIGARKPSDQGPQIVGDLLLVGTDGRIDAYGLDRLEHRWTETGPASGDGHFFDCGELLCRYSGAGTAVLDRATGRPRWQAGKQIIMYEAAGRLLTIESDRMVAEQQFLVLDGDSGKRLAELGSWELAWRSVRDAALIGFHRRADRRLLVAEFDLVAGRARPRLVLRDVTGPCSTDGQVLVCRRAGGDLGVWRLDH